MCGRYRLTRTDKELAKEFGVDLEAEAGEVAWAPRYNIAPTDVMPVVELDPEGMTCFSLKRWGLVPFWAKDPRIGASMINARSETVLEKPALADAYRKHRVLVPADGFYEWKKMPNATRSKIVRQPYNFGMKDDSIFCFAGIAAKWKSPANELIETFSILTTSPNELVKDTHDRMPVILPRSQYARWLSTHPERAEDLLELLVPYGPADMKRYPVSQKVNSPKNDSPEVMAEVAAQAAPFEAASAPTLFD